MAGAGIHPYHQQWPPAPAPPPPPATVAASLPPPPPVHHPPPASSHDEVRTVFITGLPEDFKERELQNLLRWLPGYEASQVNYKGEKPLGFALFSSAQLAVAARDALQEMVFDAESKSVLHTQMAKKNLFVKRGIVADSNSYDQSKRLWTGGDYSHSASTPSPFYPPPPPVWGPHGYLAPTPPYDPYGGYHVPPVPMPAPTPVPAPSSYVPVQQHICCSNENNGDDTTCCLIYKANILNSIRDRTANSSVPDGILDSLLLIEKFDRRLGIYPSDSMRDAFRAVAVHCTLRCLPVSWSSYFDAVQRIWELRIRNLEDLGATNLLSPDLAQWRTKIEGALWDNEASQRLLNICSLGEALNCIGAYLREAFRSMKPASCRLAMVPTAWPTVDHAASASVSSPTEENGDLRENSHSSPGGLEEDRSSSRNHGNLSTSEVNELLPMAHEINAAGLQAGPIDSHHEAVEVGETVAIDTAREGLHKEESNKDKSDPTTSICPATYYCNDKGKRRHPLPPTVDNVVASAQVPSSPHRCTNDGNVDNSVSASAQLQLIPYCCTDKENGNMRENSHSSPGRHEGPVSTAELQAGPTDSLNEALEVTETVASDKARESLHMEDPNEDMGDPTTSHCPTTHNCNDSGKRTTRANSRRYKVLSSRRRHKRPVIISDLEEVERVASDMGSEDLHAKAIEEDSNKDKGDPTNCCSDKGKRSPMVISQTRRDSNSSPKHSEGPAAYADAKVDLSSYKKYGSISSPEIEKVRDSLKSSVADLLAAVTDPLPRVLEVADRIASYVAAAKELHTECAERDGKEEKGVTATSTDCNIEHAQAKMRVSNEAVRKDHNRMDGSVQAKRKAPDEVIGKDHERTDMNFPAPSVNHTAEPSQAEEGNDAYIRPKSVCRTRLMERNDTAHTVEWEDTIEGSEEGTSGSSNKCSLPSPKTNHVSPLKRSESLKWARRRKINRWTDEEEKALIEGVRKYGSQWKLILSVYAEILSNRTQVDLKDKWRNLSRKC